MTTATDTETDPVPRLSPEEARDVLRELWGLDGELRPLPSYESQNFRLRTAGGEAWVLKISNHSMPREALEAQVLALEHLATRLPSGTVPRCRPTLSGERLVAVGPPDRPYRAHLLSYLEGVPLAKVRSSPALFLSLGELVATVDRALAGFDHPATRRYRQWDMPNAPELLNDTALIAPPRRRCLAERILTAFEAEVLPRLHELPAGVIHNDGNTYNVLATETGDAGSPDRAPRACGVIDFEDLIHTRRVFGPAIAAAYAMLDQDDPLAVAAAVVAGYHRVTPLAEPEIEVLFATMRARLAVSVTFSNRESRHQPDNAYLTVNERPAWETMERLAGVDPELARERFADACGGEGAARRKRTLGGRSAAEILDVRRRHLGPSFSVSYRSPLKIVRGWMQYLFDDAGRAYLDGVNNVCHVGHCHPRVVDAVARQMGALNTNTRYLHDHLADYAERLVKRLPDPLSVCYFVCSGSEANDLALRLARAHTGQPGVVVVDGAYHGHTGRLIDLSPYKYDGPGGAGEPAHVRKVTMPDGYRQAYPHSDPEAGRKYAGHVAAAAAELDDAGHGVAAFFCEPLLGCGGQVIPPAGYLEHAFRHVRHYGGVCIADEVQVGFGRVGSHFWAFETQGVVPDVVTLGKPIGNGHPLAAVVTTPEIAASFANGMEYFNTFGGNPVSCAAGLAVLEAIEEEGLQAHALEVGGRLLAGLEGLKEKHPLVGDVRGLGLFLGVELVTDRELLVPAAAEASAVVEGMKERGILLSTDGPLHNVIKIKPPLPFAAENAERLIAELDEVLGGIEAAAG